MGRVLTPSQDETDRSLVALKNCVDDEIAYEQKLDRCLARLAPIVDEDRLAEYWRDVNRTRATSCLYSLTLCNDENEVRMTGEAITQRQVNESVVDHPLFTIEARTRKNMAEFVEDKYLAMVAPMSQATRQRRETTECTFQRCHILLEECENELSKIQKDMSWCEKEIARRKQSILSHLRFAVLYRETEGQCQPVVAKCRSGARLMRISLTNGPAHKFDFRSGWAGFHGGNGGSVVQVDRNYFVALLSMLRSGRSSQLQSYLDQTHKGSVSGDLSGQGLLRAGKSWSVDLEVDPTIQNHAFVVMPSNDDMYGRIRFLIHDSVKVFDESANFVFHDGVRPTSINADRWSGKVKRDAERERSEECGCSGDPVPHFERHLSQVVLTDVAAYDLTAVLPPFDPYNSKVEDGAAVLSIEELRWTAPYTEGIGPDVKRLPNEYPNAHPLHNLLNFADYPVFGSV
jgi:hypothetical protein